MSRPTYRELEKRIKEMEKSLSENITEKTLIEEKLSKNNERYELAFKGASDGIWDWPDVTKDKEWWSPRWYELLGYEDGEVKACYSNFIEFLHPDDLGRVKEAVKAHFEKRSPFDMKYRLKTKSGGYKWFRGHGQALRDGDGRPVRMAGSIQDIDRRKRSEELTGRQKEFLHMVRESLSHPFYVINVQDYTIAMANASAAPDDMSETATCYSLTHKRSKPCGGDEHICPLEEVKRTKKSVVLEHLHYGRDGDLRNVEIHAHPLFDKNGNVVQMIEYTLDITERKRAEEALVEERNLLRALIDHLRDLVYAKDAAGRFIVANEAVANYMGAAASEELIGRTDFEYYPKKTAENFYADEQDIMQSGRAIVQKEEVIKNSSGENSYFSTTKVPYRDSSGRNVGIVGLGRDITERKKMEDELREKTHDLGERVKELRCLYGISNIVEKPDISLEEIMQGTAEMVPGGWQYPAITCARIIIEGREYVSPKFRETRWKQESKITISGSKAGNLQVYYLEERPESDDGPFLKEERNLIDNIAEWLGRIVERVQANMRAKLAQTAVETALTAIISTDLEETITYANPAAARMWGYDCASDMIGTKVLDHHPESALSKAKKIFKHLHQKGIYFEKEGLPCKRRDGSVFTAELSSALIKDVSGKPLGMISSFMDISRRKRAEEDIINLAKFPSENTSPVLRIRKDGTLLYSNRAGKVLCDKWDCDVGRPVPEYWCRAISATIRAKEERVEEINIKDRIFSMVIVPVPGTDYVNIYAHNITELKLAEKQIRSSLKEKEVLLKEVHHRVKNNMQVVSSLISLQARFIKDEQVLRILRDNQNRLKTMALIHEKLYRSNDLSKIDFREYLKSLTNDLFRAYRVDTRKIYLKMEVSDIFFEVEQAIPCGLIINELVSNALKHAFPGQRSGEIRVSCRSAGNGGIELTVGDDGIGIPGELDLSGSSSLGLYMVKMLGEDQLQGKIKIDRSGGSEFRITFGKK